MSPLLGPDGRPLEPSPAPVVTVEEYEALKQRAEQVDDYQDRWLRLQAEFDNARKRFTRESRELEERAGERVLTDLLGIVDDFERALAAAAGDSDPEHLRAGLTMIHRRMLEFLKTHGVEPIEAVGRPFDPARHEAVGHDASKLEPERDGPSPAPTGPLRVAAELRKGYLYRGRVLRPATVTVAGSEGSSSGGG